MAFFFQEASYAWTQFFGLDLKDAPLSTPASFARVANFVDTDILGSIKKAKGPVKINATTITNHPKVYGLIEYKQTDGDLFFIVTSSDGKIYKIDSNGIVTNIDLLTLAFATGATPSLFIYNNLVLIGDGLNEPLYIYRDVITAAATANTVADVYQLGIKPPAANPGAAVGAAGALTGTYYYKTIFVSGTGNLSAPKDGAGSGPVNPVAQRVDLTAISRNADAKQNVAKRRIYRTVNLGAILEANAEYYFVTELNDNTTTIYTDNITDASLGERLFNDHDPPVAGLMGFTEYNNSVYAFVKDTHDLRYSRINNCESWSSFAIEPITPGDGGNIKGLGRLNSLVIFKEKSIDVWTGFPGLFRRIRKAQGVGSVNSSCIKNVDLPQGGDVLFFLSQWGPYFFDEQDPFPVGREVEPIFNGRDPIYQFNHFAASKSTASYSFEDKKYFLSIPVNGASDNNLLLIYDVWSKSWTIREPFYAGAITTRTNTAFQAKIVGGESRDDVTNGGFVFELEASDSYLTGDYKGEYVTAWTHCERPDAMKLAIVLEVDAITSGPSLTYIDVFVDGSEKAILTNQVDFSLNGSEWDQSLWDTAIFSADSFKTAIIGLNKINFRHISIGFRSLTKNSPWHILQARLRFTALPNAGVRR